MNEYGGYSPNSYAKPCPTDNIFNNTFDKGYGIHPILKDFSPKPVDTIKGIYINPPDKEPAHSGSPTLMAIINAINVPGDALGEDGAEMDTTADSPEQEYPDPFDTAETFTENPAVNTMLEQGWVRQASTVKEVLADPGEIAKRESETLFAWRPPQTVWKEQTKDATHGVEVVTEADALRDFDYQMGRLTSAYGELAQRATSKNRQLIKNNLTTIANLRNSLSFIDNQDLQAACDTFADYWLARLNSGKDIYIGTTHTTGQSPTSLNAPYYKSNHLMLAKILQSFHERHDPEYTLAERIQLVKPDHTLDSNVREQIIKHGLIFVDDWSVTGAQMAEDVKGFTTIPASAKQVQYVCAPANHIDKGIGGAQVKSYFKRPPICGITELSSITGSHSDTDYGFRHTLSGLYNVLKDYAPDDCQNYPFPLLYRIARVYRPEDYMSYLPVSEQRKILGERSEAFRAGVEAFLRRLVKVQTPAGSLSAIIESIA